MDILQMYVKGNREVEDMVEEHAYGEFGNNVTSKGVVHLKKKKLLLISYSPPCHPRCPCLSFFSRKEIRFSCFYHVQIRLL